MDAVVATVLREGDLGAVRYRQEYHPYDTPTPESAASQWAPAGGLGAAWLLLHAGRLSLAMDVRMWIAAFGSNPPLLACDKTAKDVDEHCGSHSDFSSAFVPEGTPRDGIWCDRDRRFRAHMPASAFVGSSTSGVWNLLGGADMACAWRLDSWFRSAKNAARLTPPEYRKLAVVPRYLTPSMGTLMPPEPLSAGSFQSVT